MLVEDRVYEKFVVDFNNELYKVRGRFSNIIFFCIGTDRLTGDSFGPIVGYKLTYLLSQLETYNNIEVIGNLEKQISFNNIEDEIKRVYEQYSNPCIIAIDAALSNQDEIGKIFVQDKKLNIGKSLNKKSIAIGDISIKGVVAQNYKILKNNFQVLQSTPLGRVMNLADITSRRNI